MACQIILLVVIGLTGASCKTAAPVEYEFARPTRLPVPIAPKPKTIICNRGVNKFLFDLNSVALKGEAQATLKPIIASMKEHPRDRITFVGHTCDLGARIQ